MMDKENTYKRLVKQISALLEGENDAISVMANVSAAIHETTKFFWVGFYIWKDGALRLGPFQGSVACTTIPEGRGVCGTAYLERRTIIVPDVELFPGHIACSNQSRSEIVVPILDCDESVKAVLDIDSTEQSTFNETDRLYLEQIAALVSPHI